MATSLLDGLKSMVTPEFLSGAARNLGESEGAVATGLGAAFRPSSPVSSPRPGIPRQCVPLRPDFESRE